MFLEFKAFLNLINIRLNLVNIDLDLFWILFIKIFGRFYEIFSNKKISQSLFLLSIGKVAKFAYQIDIHLYFGKNKRCLRGMR